MTVDKHDLELLAEVQRRVEGTREDEAAHILDAVVEALGELLTPEEALLVGPHLSDRLQRILMASAQRHSYESKLADFVEAVSWRENVGIETAVMHAHAVCDAVIDALPLAVQLKLRDGLPTDVVQFLRGESEPAVLKARRRTRPSA